MLSAVPLTKHFHIHQLIPFPPHNKPAGRRSCLPLTLVETEAQNSERSCGRLPWGTWQSRDLNPGCLNHKDCVCPTVSHSRLREPFRSWHPAQGNCLHFREKTQSLDPQLGQGLRYSLCSWVPLGSTCFSVLTLGQHCEGKQSLNVAELEEASTIISQA